MKIRLCHLQLLPILGGAQRAMLEIFEHLDRRRYELHVACGSAGELSDELRRRGIACHIVPSLVRQIRPWHDVRAWRALAAFFRERAFQIVHTHSSKPGLLGRIAARQAGVPHVIHHVHGFAFHEHSSPLTHAAYRLAERWAGKFCDRVIFVSHEEREIAIQSGLLPAEKCLTIHNGVDQQRFSPQRPHRASFRAEHGLGADEAIIAFVGRLALPKNPDILPDVADALEKLCPRRRWRFLIAGDGPLRGAMEQKITALGLHHRIKLLGWLADTERVFHGSDVATLTSLAEGLPLTLIEAQATGLPIVASDAKGNRDVVSHDTGFLCAPRDAGDFARHFALLIENEHLRRAFGQAARARAERLFDSAKNVPQVAALYESLLASRRPSGDLPQSAGELRRAA